MGGGGGGEFAGAWRIAGKERGRGWTCGQWLCYRPTDRSTLTVRLGHVHAAPIAFAGCSNLFHALGAPTSLTDDDDGEEDGDDINPFTAPACTFSELKSVYIHACKQYI